MFFIVFYCLIGRQATLAAKGVRVAAGNICLQIDSQRYAKSALQHDAQTTIIYKLSTDYINISTRYEQGAL